MGSLRNPLWEASDRSQLLHRSGAKALETPESLEQEALASGPDSWDFIQNRTQPAFPSQTPMIPQGKPVGLVAHLLKQVLASRAIRETDGVRPARPED